MLKLLVQRARPLRKELFFAASLSCLSVSTWSMKFGMTLWKIEFLYVNPLVPLAISAKFLTVLGTTCNKMVNFCGFLCQFCEFFKYFIPTMLIKTLLIVICTQRRKNLNEIIEKSMATKQLLQISFKYFPNLVK